jgi:phosphatidylserine/phosphatidylglycerophosphate/cardiolipin synthase-like enzyme
MLWFNRHPDTTSGLIDSSLYNEDTFYDRFAKDLKNCHSEVIIESPFITSRRLYLLIPSLQKLKSKHVRVTINTRDPETHDDENTRREARFALSKLQHMGVNVLFTGGHHRKLAIIDRSILYEGSLNILSQNNSCEVMRRIESTQLAWQMIRFVKIDDFVR